MAVYIIKHELSDPPTPSDRYVEIKTVDVKDYVAKVRTDKVNNIEFVVGATSFKHEVEDGSFIIKFPFKEGVVDIMIIGRI